MKFCAASTCQDPPCTLVAISHPEGKEWRFCLRHFWPGCHTLMNRGAERVIVKYPSGARRVATGGAPYPGRSDTNP